MNNIILIKNLKKRFGSSIAIDGITFSISKGEIFSFLGPSGSGKTTTINILTNQLDKDSGEALVFGKDSSNLSRKDLTKIGIVSDSIGYYPKMTLYKNLEFFAKLYEISLNQVDELLKRLELYDSKDVKAEQLSTGMRQRMLLIRAILHCPDMLFLDEPTSGLDPRLTMIVHDLLLELKSKGVSIFLTTHNMQEAEKLSDYIALLYRGKIVEEGKPEEIILKHSEANNFVTIFYKDGSKKIVGREHLSANITSDVINITSGKLTLDDIFIKLTGDKLND